MDQVFKLFKRLDPNLKSEEDLLIFLQNFFDIEKIQHIKLKNPVQAFTTLFDNSKNEIEEILSNPEDATIIFLRGINFTYYVILPKDDRILGNNTGFILLWKNKKILLSLKELVKWISEISINR